MSAKDDESAGDSFNISKAELFEALGHPTRIRLLEILTAKPSTFSEMKRASEIESNGLLGFHLGKLTGLVRLNSDGLYSLTDEGKEAIRIIQTTTQARKIAGREKSSSFHSILVDPLMRLRYRRTSILLAILLAALIAMGTVVVHQQQQLITLGNSTNSSTVSINGQQYSYREVSPSNFFEKKSLDFAGVNFTVAPALLGGSTFFVTGALSKLNMTGDGLYTFTIVPNIVVNFGKGNTENWSYNPEALWLSQHNDPRAGISYDQNTGLLAFYVSQL